MKNNKELILNYYEALKNMYVDKVEDKGKFVHISSNIIDDGIWNFVCNIKASTIEELEDIFNSSKQLFSNRKSRFYMLRSETNEDILQQVKENYTIYCEDSWFYTKLEKLNLNHKSKLPISIRVSNNKEEVINTIMTGFSTGDPNDPYGDLSPTYRQSLELKFESSIMEGQTLHFVAKFKNKPISIATCTIKGDIAYLNNVTTLKEFKGQGIAKEVLSVAVNTLKQKDVTHIMFATETGMYTEQFYKNLGFEVIDYGYCFE